ncbi:unnamed protein product [Peniophora sp. CBMAI 1063]|nr:unnamed protein product [Peniophora sp. CBMAI 1063]
MALNLVGVESFNLDKSIQRRGGCFPYTNAYPYSHSLAGMVGLGTAYAAWYTYSSPRALDITDAAAIAAMSASHFFLELPGHRHDVKVTPSTPRSQELGAGQFDSPASTFALEVAVFLSSLAFYAWRVPSVRQDTQKLLGVGAVLVAEQAMFSFGSAPTSEVRFVHAPIFLAQILGSCWLLGKLDS